MKINHFGSLILRLYIDRANKDEEIADARDNKT